MKLKLISALLLVFVGQNNIFHQKQVFFWQKMLKISQESSKNRQKLLFLVIDKQKVTKMRDYRQNLLRFWRILPWFLLEKGGFFFNFFRKRGARFLTFFFYSVKPNCFGCCLSTR